MAMEKESEIVEEIASILFESLCEIDESWETGFFRFSYCNGSYDASGSFQTSDSTVFILDGFEHSEVYNSLCDLCPELFRSIKKDEGLILVVVKSDSTFEIFFEYENLKKWRITMLDGKSGIPEGFAEGK